MKHIPPFVLAMVAVALAYGLIAVILVPNGTVADGDELALLRVQQR